MAPKMNLNGALLGRRGRLKANPGGLFPFRGKTGSWRLEVSLHRLDLKALNADDFFDALPHNEAIRTLREKYPQYQAFACAVSDTILSTPSTMPPASQMLDGIEVAKHNSRESCWVIIKGRVYDVTDFLDEHPGGVAIVLQYGGKDATEEYDPIHPPGTIEQNLDPSKHLGPVDLATVASSKKPQEVRDLDKTDDIPLQLMMSLADLELAASKRLSRRAWTFYHSAADTLASHDANLGDWNKITFRPRIMRDVARVSMDRTILGVKLGLPFFCAPAARARLAHDDGESCIARAAARRNMGYCTSNVASVAHDVLMNDLLSDPERTGGALFFQLYVPRDKSKAAAIIQNARDFGYKALVITVDAAVIGKREEDERYQAELSYQAGMSDQASVPRTADDRPTLEADLPILRGAHSSSLDWDDLPWIREAWGNAGPLVLKGIQTAEDAKLAAEMGVDAIYLSNHGGRQADHAPSSVRTLLEIRRFCPEVLGKVEILMDGGFRRGADVLKALALGASAVGLGRPFLYACSWGTEGVLKAVQLLSDEVETTMRLIGVTSLEQLTPDYVNTTVLERELPPRVGQMNWYKGPDTGLVKSKL